jgi:hypothetical protein
VNKKVKRKAFINGTGNSKDLLCASLATGRHFLIFCCHGAKVEVGVDAFLGSLVVYVQYQDYPRLEMVQRKEGHAFTIDALISSKSLATMDSNYLFFKQCPEFQWTSK